VKQEYPARMSEQQRAQLRALAATTLETMYGNAVNLLEWRNHEWEPEINHTFA